MKEIKTELKKEIQKEYEPKFEKTFSDFLDLKSKMNKTNLQIRKNKEKLDEIDLAFLD